MNNNKKIGLGLERTVQWCVDNISNIYNTSEILSKFGIRVIDQLETEEDLLEHYPPETYAGEFGNAVLIGTETPFDYYIWTREFPEDIDPEHPVNGLWLNIGQFPLAGPPGKDAVGIRGERGERGKSWFSGVGAPGSTTILDAMVGDLYFQTAPEFGAVYRYNGTVWQYQGNLKGSAGSAGSQGPAGPAGPVVDLVGIVETVGGMLPVEEAVAQYGRQVAYLVGAENEPKMVWGAIGPDDDLQWAELGMFATGTLVYENGRPVESIEMNQYVRFTPANVSTQVVAYDRATSQYVSKPLTYNPENNTVAMRTTNGTLKAKDPVESTDLTTKNYVDQTIAGVVHDKYFHAFDISHREWVDDPESESGGYDEVIVSGPYYIDLIPGMDFYIDVDFEMPDTLPLIQLQGNYSQSGGNWQALWDDYAQDPSKAFTAQYHYHIVVSKESNDGYIVVRTETTYPDDNRNPAGPAYRIDGYDMRQQTTSGYNRFRLKIGYNQDYSWIDYYNTIAYTGNVEPSF